MQWKSLMNTYTLAVGFMPQQSTEEKGRGKLQLTSLTSTLTFTNMTLKTRKLGSCGRSQFTIQASGLVRLVT